MPRKKTDLKTQKSIYRMLHMAITWWYQHKDHSLFVSILTRQYYSNMSFSVDAYIHCSLDRSIYFCWQLKCKFINGISFIYPSMNLVSDSPFRGDIFSSQRTPSEAQGVCSGSKNSCWWGFPLNLFCLPKSDAVMENNCSPRKVLWIASWKFKKMYKTYNDVSFSDFEGASDIENILGD